MAVTGEIELGQPHLSMLDAAFVPGVIGLVKLEVGSVCSATLVFDDFADGDFAPDRRFDSEDDPDQVVEVITDKVKLLLDHVARLGAKIPDAELAIAALFMTHGQAIDGANAR